MRIWSLVKGTWLVGEDADADAWWFDVVGPASGLDALAERFGLHPLSVEDCYSTLLHVPKIDDFGDHLFIVLQTLVGGIVAKPELGELDAFLGPDFLITYADVPISEIETAHDALTAGITLRPGPDGLFHAIADRTVDDLLPAVNAMGDELDALQDAVVENPGGASNGAALEIRARAGRLRRVISAQIPVAMRLSRGEFPVVQEANRIYFRDVYDHLLRVDLSLEGIREDAEVALSTYLSAINNRMNEVMKVLSVVTALALPSVVITGIFGTNFDNVPGLHSNWGFTFMLGSMAGMAGGMAYYFRRRGWF